MDVVELEDVGALGLAVVPCAPLALVVGVLLVLGLVLAPLDGLAETLGLAAVGRGAPPLCDVTANAAPAPAATRTKDVVEMTIRLRMARSLPRMRAAVAPAVFAAPAARSIASESVLSKSLDTTARSPFGWSAAARM
jgi:hypothetical protein